MRRSVSLRGRRSRASAATVVLLGAKFTRPASRSESVLTGHRVLIGQCSGAQLTGRPPRPALAGPPANAIAAVTARARSPRKHARAVIALAGGWFDPESSWRPLDHAVIARLARRPSARACTRFHPS